MTCGAVTLDAQSRAIVLATIQDVCRHQSWTLYAAHVRATHVHVVVEAEPPPEEVMGKLKAHTSRAVNRHVGHNPKRWTRHGSTRRLWSPREVDSAVQYVIHRQGDPMALYEKPNRWSFLATPASKP
jgi:REP element-mobilizing transposase RayT